MCAFYNQWSVSNYFKSQLILWSRLQGWVFGLLDRGVWLVHQLLVIEIRIQKRFKLSKFHFTKSTYYIFKQSLFTHRLFWAAHACFQIITLFQEFLRPFNILMNLSKSVISQILLLYALYKPHDKITTFMEAETEMPTWVRIFFDKFENSRIVVKILGLRVRE